MKSDILDIQIGEESGGYLLMWTGRLTSKSGDSWHESLKQAENQAEVDFDLVPGQWARAHIRRAVERSFPSADVPDILSKLCALRKGDRAQAAALVFANGDLKHLAELAEATKNEPGDPSHALDWRRSYGERSVPPEELVRRFEALGLAVPEIVAEQAKERLRTSTPPGDPGGFPRTS